MQTFVVIGGGAAGFFGAIACAEKNSGQRVILIEKHRQLLSKVRISGGGRCNVTHACFDPALLVQSYPRGHKELRSAFSRFQPRDTIHWFEARGVTLKTEADGRMFPVTDSSETIISCLLEEAKKHEVEIRTETHVVDCERILPTGFRLTLADGSHLLCDTLLVATGGVTKTLEWLHKLGHTIIPPVPSLFTFNVPDSPLHTLAGISLKRAKLSLPTCKLEETGPLLITHWGFSGPAVLRLSAWGARALWEQQYQLPLTINWIPDYSLEALKHQFAEYRSLHPTRQVSGEPPLPLPKQLWKHLIESIGVGKELRWSMLSKQLMQKMVDTLQKSAFAIQGKSTNKEEFVTCGGIKLQEVDFRTMESRICPGLYFAGEVLDIDGVTGGYNFQNAWTTGWIAGTSQY